MWRSKAKLETKVILAANPELTQILELGRVLLNICLQSMREHEEEIRRFNGGKQ
jgi:hypothetical protein